LRDTFEIRAENRVGLSIKTALLSSRFKQYWYFVATLVKASYTEVPILHDELGADTTLS